MISKAEIIRRHLDGLTVFDVGGAGYGQSNAYERELASAWKVCRRRVCVDASAGADLRVDLNALPLPEIGETYDVATAFDVLEHLEHPVDVLRWLPGRRLIVTLPNALSWIARRMERTHRSRHLYSFTPYTASILLGEGGWRVARREYQFGKWSPAARIVNAVGSLTPSRVGTGIVFYCDRSDRLET